MEDEHTERTLVREMSEFESKIVFQESTINPKTNTNFTIGNETLNNIANHFKNIFYSCSECKSIIEILSIDENNISFKCNNKNKKHELTLSIKEYLNKMKTIGDEELNNDICNKHFEKYNIYCSDCDIHLCEERNLDEHNNHKKIDLKQIKLDKDKLIFIINTKNEIDISDEEKEKYFDELIGIIYITYNICNCNYYNNKNIMKIYDYLNNNYLI